MRLSLLLLTALLSGCATVSSIPSFAPTPEAKRGANLVLVELDMDPSEAYALVLSSATESGFIPRANSDAARTFTFECREIDQVLISSCATVSGSVQSRDGGATVRFFAQTQTTSLGVDLDPERVSLSGADGSLDREVFRFMEDMAARLGGRILYARDA